MHGGAKKDELGYAEGSIQLGWRLLNATLSIEILKWGYG